MYNNNNIKQIDDTKLQTNKRDQPTKTNKLDLKRTITESGQLTYLQKGKEKDRRDIHLIDKNF